MWLNLLILKFILFFLSSLFSFNACFNFIFKKIFFSIFQVYMRCPHRMIPFISCDIRCDPNRTFSLPIIFTYNSYLLFIVGSNKFAFLHSYFVQLLARGNRRGSQLSEGSQLSARRTPRRCSCPWNLPPIKKVRGKWKVELFEVMFI